MAYPFVQILEEGKTADFKFTDLTSLSEGVFKGVPWRLLSLNWHVAASYRYISEQIFIGDPAVLQVRLHSAREDNVEAIASLRSLVGLIPTRGYLTMPAPNPWKEDEDRTQALFSFDNVKTSTNSPTTITILGEARLEFGSLIFQTPKTLQHFSPSAPPQTRKLFC